MISKCSRHALDEVSRYQQDQIRKFDCRGVCSPFGDDDMGDGLGIFSDDSWFYCGLLWSALTKVKLFSALSALKRDLESVFSPDYGIND